MVTALNIIYCFFMIAFGITGYIFLVKKTKDKLNPFALVCISWCILGGIASLHLSWLETDWTLNMYLIVLIFPILVFLCGIIGKNENLTYNGGSYLETGRLYIILTRMIGIVCIACAFIEWWSNGFILTLFIKGVCDIKSEFKALPVIHYGSIYFPYCAIIAIYELLYRKDKSIITILYNILIIILNVAYALVISVSRGSLIIIFCAAAYMIMRRYNIKFWQIILMIFATLVGFMYISKLRINEGSLVYDVIKGHPIISSVYGYTALSFENLNKLTQKGPAYTIFSSTYHGFIELLGLRRFFPQTEYLTTYFFNTTTICYEFYEDLGIIGVVIDTLIIFGTIRYLYEKSKKEIGYVLMIAVMQKAIWMTFFGNYFTIYRVMIFPYIITLIVILSLKVDFSFKDGFKVLKKKEEYCEKKL